MHTATRFPLERFAALDRAIRAGGFPNARTLADALEVNPRTIQRDVAFLRDRLNAPIVFDAKRRGYVYGDPAYQLPLLALTEGELVALLVAERVLQEYRGTPYGPDLARAFAKITAGLADVVTIDLRYLSQVHSFRTSAPAPFEPAIFRDLVSAASRRRRVVIDYWTASTGESNRRAVDPYHIASVDGHFYVLGYCHLRAKVRVFVPGRIRSLELTDEAFEVPEGFRADAYLAHAFAILRGEDGERHRVRLRFTGEAVRYIRERTWHPSQVLEPTPEGDLIVTLELSHLREVEKWALSWGGDCEVLEPPVLRQQVAACLASASARYGVPPGAPDASRARRGKDGDRIDHKLGPDGGSASCPESPTRTRSKAGRRGRGNR